MLVDDNFFAADRLLEQLLTTEQSRLSGDSATILERIYALCRIAIGYRGQLLPATDSAARLRMQELFGSENQVYSRELNDRL